MPHRALPFVGLALVLAGLGYGLRRATQVAVPRGEEATHRLAAESLLAERDLIFDHRDLERGYRAWPGGPRGIALRAQDEGASFRYAAPIAASLAALPFMAVLGGPGWLVANALLFVAAFAASWWWLGSAEGPPRIWVVGFFFASAALGYVFRFGPETFRLAAVLLALLAWQAVRRREEGDRRPRHLAVMAAAGALLAAAGTHAPLDLVAVIPIAADLAWSRRGRPLLAFLATGLAVFGGLLLVQHRLVGAAWPADSDPAMESSARVYYEAFPIEGPAEIWSAAPVSRPAGAHREPVRVPGPADAGVLLAGRTTGLLPFLPFALVGLAAGLGRDWDSQRALLLAALLIGCGALLATGTARPTGLGDSRLVGLYPLFLLLPRRGGAAGVHLALALAGMIAAGLWTAPALLASLASTPRSTPSPAFSYLPLELRLAAGNRLGSSIPTGGLPGYGARLLGDAVWLLPEDSFFVAERNPRGVWMQGASTADVIVVSQAPLERLSFTAVSLAADSELEVDGGAGAVRVVFDSAGKRAGTPIELPLAAASEARGGFFPRERRYRLRISVSGGLVPARRDPSSSDPRYLGVFLDTSRQGR